MIQWAWLLGTTNDANKKFICDGNSDIMLNDCPECDFHREWLDDMETTVDTMNVNSETCSTGNAWKFILRCM